MFGGQKELEQLGKQQEAESFQSQQLHNAMQRNQTPKKPTKNNCGSWCAFMLVFIAGILLAFFN